MAVSSPLGSRQTVAALLTLTAVTGLVDAVSYLRLGRVFVANMTGNLVFLGFSADPHSGLSAATPVIAIAGFALGALAGGRAAHSLAARSGRWLSAAFTGEAVILGLVAVLTGTGVLPFTGDGRFATVAILAAALGVQNSTVRHLGAPDLTTTVLTLTLTGLTADSVLAGGPGARPHRRLGSVAAMLVGAAAGAGILQWSPVAVIAIAAALVAAVAAAFMTAVAATGRGTAPNHDEAGLLAGHPCRDYAAAGSVLPRDPGLEVAFTAPGIVARDGGDRCRGRPNVRAPGRAGRHAGGGTAW